MIHELFVNHGDSRWSALILFDKLHQVWYEWPYISYVRNERHVRDRMDPDGRRSYTTTFTSTSVPLLWSR